jgi:hypothetical protein
LYGFTETYRETRDARYLQQATHIADFLLRHPNLPADKIPYWDFNAPDIPAALRDASAAAIMASALLELIRLCRRQKKAGLFQRSGNDLRNLSTDTYKAKTGTNGGFLTSTWCWSPASQIRSGCAVDLWRLLLCRSHETLCRLALTVGGHMAAPNNFLPQRYQRLYSGILNKFVIPKELKQKLQQVSKSLDGDLFTDDTMRISCMPPMPRLTANCHWLLLSPALKPTLKNLFSLPARRKHR